jgi:chromosome segregation ATPase
MIPHRLGLRSILTLSCVGFLTSAGCVSQQQFARVEQERQRLASELAQQQELTTVARQEKAEISSQLDAAIAEGGESATRAADAEQQVIAVRQQLATAEQATNQIRTQLAESAAREAQLTTQLKAVSASLATIDREHHRMTDEHKARQTELVQLRQKLNDSEAARADVQAKLVNVSGDLHESMESLATARHDVRSAQAEAKAAREKLAQVELSAADARKKLAESEKNVAMLKAKVEAAAALAKRGPQAGDAAKATAVVDPGNAD